MDNPQKLPLTRDEIQAKLAGKKGKHYWRCLEEIAETPEFMEYLADEVPQMLAVVRLKEGPHINTTLVGLTEAQIEIGMQVTPVFDDIVPGETTLLRYTRKI